MRATAPFGFRYQYLAGGVNTGNGWATWNADGAFVTYYIQDFRDNGIIPVFTYYMLYQSAPGNRQGEADGVAANLGNPATMRAYYDDLQLSSSAPGVPRGAVVLHVEPDLWGYVQQRARGDDPATVPARWARPACRSWPGCRTRGRVRPGDRPAARPLRPQRDAGLPRQRLGHRQRHPLHRPAGRHGGRPRRAPAAFYRALRAPFDLVFAEFSDRDAGFKQYSLRRRRGLLVGRGRLPAPRALPGPPSCAVTQRRLVLWQIPFGNTRMRAMNNTWNHYQDNQVEWLLDDPARGHLQEYVRGRGGGLPLRAGGGRGHLPLRRQRGRGDQPGPDQRQRPRLAQRRRRRGLLQGAGAGLLPAGASCSRGRPRRTTASPRSAAAPARRA